MDAFTPQQTTELVCRIGCKKAGMRLDKLIANSFMTGPLLGFGCAITLSTETAPWFQQNAPGLIRTIGASFFPIGLVMIVLSGSDLFTSNIMFMICALLHRRVSILDLARVWVVSFFGNLAGMLFFMAIVTGYGGVFRETPEYHAQVLNFATMKAVDPQWHQILCRAIGANWLVCFAVFISISSREIVSKIIAIWFPTLAFVALGLDHVVANMYFIPIAIWNGHPQITVGYYIWKSMIPTLIGNLIGGGIFVGAAYWYLYLTGEGEVTVHFNTRALQSGMTVGGPMGDDLNGHGHGDAKTLHGMDPNEERDSGSQTPHSGSQMMSGIGRELSAEKYGKKSRDKEGANAAVNASAGAV